MLAALGFILDGIVMIGQYVLWALEVFGNLVITTIVGMVGWLFAVLPAMSAAPALGDPEWLHWLTWFFPIGQLIAILAAGVTVWVAFLAIRWLMRFLRAL